MTPYRFDVIFLPSDAYRVRCGDVHGTTLRGLARLLVEGDAADGPIEGGRHGRVDWTVASLHRFAAGGVPVKEATQQLDALHPALRVAVVQVRAEIDKRKADA